MKDPFYEILLTVLLAAAAIYLTYAIGWLDR